jgi:hypothetical protein
MCRIIKLFFAVPVIRAQDENASCSILTFLSINPDASDTRVAHYSLICRFSVYSHPCGYYRNTCVLISTSTLYGVLQAAA